jgi:hypothetical protein
MPSHLVIYFILGMLALLCGGWGVWKAPNGPWLYAANVFLILQVLLLFLELFGKY